MIQNLDNLDYALVGIAIVASVYTLVVLLNRRRKLTVERLRNQVEAESQRSKESQGGGAANQTGASAPL